MQRIALFVASFALCILAILGFAQGPSVHLCVAGMQLNGGSSSNVAGRDVLIKFLSKEKGDKVLSIENEPISPSVPEDALAVAKQESCDYVVTTNQTENTSESSYWGASGVNMQTFFVTTAYKLTKVSDRSELSSGSVKASDKGSEQNAVTITLKKIADKVTQTIRKAGPVVK
jgi:hypothetical protein